MYRRLYRQEGGGLGGLNPHDYMRQEVDKYVQDYNRRNQGEVAAKVMPRPNFIQRNIEPYKNKLYDKLANLAGDEERVQTMSDLRIEGSNLKNPVYFPSELETGLMSDLRHKSASNTLSQNLSPNIPGGEIIGDSLSFLGGGLRELKNMLPPILTGRTEQENLENWRATQEDLKANKEGTFNTPNTTTTEDIYREGLNLPKQVQPITREEFEQTLPGGYRPLNVTYDSYWDGYGTKPYADILKEKGETRKGSYSGMPVILSPKNADFFQQYFQGPLTQLHTRPENRAAKIAHMEDYYKIYPDTFWNQYQEQQQQANAFQPVATPISMQNEQPINTGGFGVDFTNSNRDLINATDFNLLQNYYQGQQ